MVVHCAGNFQQGTNKILVNLVILQPWSSCSVTGHLGRPGHLGHLARLACRLVYVLDQDCPALHDCRQSCSNKCSKFPAHCSSSGGGGSSSSSSCCCCCFSCSWLVSNQNTFHRILVYGRAGVFTWRMFARMLAHTRLYFLFLETSKHAETCDMRFQDNLGTSNGNIFFCVGSLECKYRPSGYNVRLCPAKKARFVTICGGGRYNLPLCLFRHRLHSVHS